MERGLDPTAPRVGVLELVACVGKSGPAAPRAPCARDPTWDGAEVAGAAGSSENDLAKLSRRERVRKLVPAVSGGPVMGPI